MTASLMRFASHSSASDASGACPLACRASRSIFSCSSISETSRVAGAAIAPHRPRGPSWSSASSLTTLQTVQTPSRGTPQNHQLHHAPHGLHESTGTKFSAPRALSTCPSTTLLAAPPHTLALKHPLQRGADHGGKFQADAFFGGNSRASSGGYMTRPPASSVCVAFPPALACSRAPEPHPSIAHAEGAEPSFGHIRFRSLARLHLCRGPQNRIVVSHSSARLHPQPITRLDWTTDKLAGNHNAPTAPPADVACGPMGRVRAEPGEVVGLQREALSEHPRQKQMGRGGHAAAGRDVEGAPL